MSKLTPESAEDVHAILQPVLQAEGAKEKREHILNGQKEEELDWEALDLLIDDLLQLAERLSDGKVFSRKGKPSHPAPPPLPFMDLDDPPDLPPARSMDAPMDELDANIPPLKNAQRSETVILPAIQEAEDVSGALLPSISSESPETYALFDDIMNLSRLNDRDGVLISFGRLLTMAKVEGHIAEFVTGNEVKLLNLFETEFGTFSKVPKRKKASVENNMPRAFLKQEKIAALIPMIDGKASISKLMKKSTLSPVEACAVLSQLMRVGIIEF